MPTIIHDIENRLPCFSLVVNILKFNREKQPVKVASIVKNIYDCRKVSKSDEQRVRNIVLSIREYGVDNSQDKTCYNILSKDTEIGEIKVNVREFVDYLFSFIGQYCERELEGDRKDFFYEKLTCNHGGAIKEIIEKYLIYLTKNLGRIKEMAFSDAIPDLEVHLVDVCLWDKDNALERSESSKEVKDVIREWGAKMIEVRKKDAQFFLGWM